MIEVVVTQGRNAFVWNAEDADRLRRTHRIVGALIGCLSRAPRQNNHLGLPLKLSPEEATLLSDKGLGHLVTYDRLRGEPELGEVDKYNSRMEHIFHEQNALFKEDRKSIIKAKAEDILKGKRKKRRKSKCKVKTKDVDLLDEELRKVDQMTLSKEAASVQLFTGCSWLRGGSACPAVWDFPSTDVEKLRYHVFNDLWSKGYYLTTGGKFGGDFLAYPGDPLRFHASHVVICLPMEQHFSGLDLISRGRLGTNVKKNVLLCSANGNQLSYLSLQWTAINS